MDLQKEREALIAEIERFKEEAMKSYVVSCWAESYTNTDPFGYVILENENNKVWWLKTQAYQLWEMWQAAKAHQAEKLKGCVVVPKDQIEVWWQDSEEPENFATKEDDLSFIAQHIQDDEIMEINEHHTIHLPSITKFGAWVYQSGQRTFFVGNKDEVEAVRGGNE